VSTPSPAHRAIVEAIEAVASAEARVAILVRALGRAGLQRAPERGPEAKRFAEGPLYDAIAELLGAPVADSVLAQLRPVLTSASRPPPSGRPGPRPRSAWPAAPSERETLPGEDLRDRPTLDAFPADAASTHDRLTLPMPEPTRTRTPSASTARPEHELPAAALYLIASLDDELAIEAERTAGVSVRFIRGLFELVDTTEDLGGRDTGLLFDCASPPVHVASLLALSASMPGSLSIALLGASTLDHHALEAAPERTRRWRFLARPSAAELCAQLAAAATRYRAG
jgi:hypothetical protein